MRTLNTPDKIRIMHFIVTLWGGGAERQLAHLLNHLDSSRYENAICCIDPGGRSLFKPEIQIFPIPRRNKLDLRWRKHLELFAQWQPDIIHIWSPYVISSVVPVARLFTKIILISGYRTPEKINNILNFVQAIGLCFVDKIISNVFEDDMFTPFKQLYKWKSGEVILNGVDVEGIQSSMPLEIFISEITPSPPILLSVGRLIPGKNFGKILHAMHILEKRYALECRLVVCGEGPDLGELDNLAKELGLTEKVLFTGFSNEIYRYFKSCQALIMPTLVEGMPNVLFEGMIAKIPVIASDIPVHRRWVRHRQNGMLFDPYDVGSLADSIHAVLCMSVDQREQMIQMAFDTACDLTIERMVRNYEDLYLRQLSARRAVQSGS